MEPVDHPGGVATADILSRGARIVRQLVLRADQAVDVEYKPYAGDEALRISVHGCTPDELESHRAYFVADVVHRDADDLVRWVVAHVDDVEVTFYRR